MITVLNIDSSKDTDERENLTSQEVVEEIFILQEWKKKITNKNNVNRNKSKINNNHGISITTYLLSSNTEYDWI